MREEYQTKTHCLFIYSSKESLPELHRHFQSEHFHTSMYASSWFITLFTSQFPLSMVYRTMDLFLSEVIHLIDFEDENEKFISYFKGIELIFRLSLALLEIHQDELMLLSMEEMLKVTFWTSWVVSRGKRAKELINSNDQHTCMS